MIACGKAWRWVWAALGCLILASCGKKTLFEYIDPDHSGIHFNNQIAENDSINPMDMVNVYNGGGVGIGDFNGDGLPDIYFTGNTVSNKLYLNKGDFRFQDITDQAGVGGKGDWYRGVSVVDINNDGRPDIYVCANIRTDPAHRINLLYVNQGNDAEGIPHFKEMAAEYGLADTLYSTMAQFFDYDHDGDLDMYLTVNNVPNGYNTARFHPIATDGSGISTGHLFRNDWDSALGHPVFHDVSKEAGITIEGFGHAATIADLNRDGWDDIYVTNDFIGDNILYINNHDGTFTDKAKTYFKHTSATAMGQDIEDINNDGLADVIELDMNPPDNYRKKMFLNSMHYQTYVNSDLFGYQYQYVRNSLQLNQGPRVNGADSIGDPAFSEISWYGGIAETDWSWTPLVADFNNDGYRDLIVTTGYPKDITDHDFKAFMQQGNNIISKQAILQQIPQVKIHNFAFCNNGDLTFTDVSAQWGLLMPGFSDGAAYADLDGDGDLDLVINTINDPSHIYRNMTRERDPDHHHFLRVSFTGDNKNRDGLGVWVELHYDHGKQQVYENNPYRGYLSSIQNVAHFGLGETKVVDTVLIKWPNGKMQLLRDVACDQVIKADQRQASVPFSVSAPSVDSAALFTDVTNAAGIHYSQEEKDYVDFNIQRLLPHKLSQYGPGIAVGDIDGNGLDDLVVGGSAGYSAQLFLQQPDGRFVQQALLSDTTLAAAKQADDLGLLLFDADGDGDLDLYVVSGGNESPANSAAYRDKLYLNDGKGHFTLAGPGVLPENLTSKFCVRAADYNHDGKPDLFISGRVDPGRYPSPVSSFIYRNDSKDGKVKFTDVTATVAPELQKIGMVSDGLWTDIDNDGWPDLVLAGEWMPLTIFHNDKGVFRNITGGTGVSDQYGWWNSIVAGDFDNDGDIDYVVGNLGLNSFYRASDQYPVRVYGKDFDNDGTYDMLTSLYLPDSNGERKEFPAVSRDDLSRQMATMRKKFPSYKSYAAATMDQVLTPEQRQGATILAANQFRSCLFRNDGHGKFTMIPLPPQAQFSVLNGMVAGDLDGDGNLDLVVNGNDYGTEVSTGRYDALNGLFLKGDGKGGFWPESILASGIYIPGDGKALAALRGAGGHYLLAAGQNRGPLKLYARREKGWQVGLEPGDVGALVTLKDGRVRREEFHFGESFLSQSGRFFYDSGPVTSVEILDDKGQKRRVK
jgi:ASPIC and UnbV/FG-GAP-like repeat